MTRIVFHQCSLKMSSSDLGALLEALRDKRADRCQAALALVDLAEREDLPRGVSVASVCKLTLDEAARACAEASKLVEQGKSTWSSQHAIVNSSSSDKNIDGTNDGSTAGSRASDGLAEIKQVHRLGYLVCRVTSLIVPETLQNATSGMADSSNTSALQSIEVSVVTGQNLLSFMVNCGALLDVSLTLEDDAAAGNVATIPSSKKKSATQNAEDMNAAFNPFELVRALRRVFAAGLLQPSLEILLDLVVLLHKLNSAVSTSARSSSERRNSNHYDAFWSLGPFTSMLLPALLDECIAACGRTSNARRTFERVCAPAPLQALLAIHRDGTGAAGGCTNEGNISVLDPMELAREGGSGRRDGVRGTVEQLLRVALLPGELLPGLQALAALHFKDQQRASKNLDPARLSDGKSAAAVEETLGKKRQKKPAKGQSTDNSSSRLLAEHADSYQWRLVTVLKTFMARSDASKDELSKCKVLSSSSSGADCVALGSRGACLIVDLFASASFEAGRARADLASSGGALAISSASSMGADSNTAAAAASAAANAAAAAVVNPLKRRRVTAAGEEAAAARATFELFSALATASVAASGLSSLINSTIGSNAQEASKAAVAMEEDSTLLPPLKSAAAAEMVSYEGTSVPDLTQLHAWASGLECLGSLLRAVQRAGAYRLHEDSQGSHLAMLTHCADVALSAAQAALEKLVSVKVTPLTPPLTSEKLKKKSSASVVTTAFQTQTDSAEGVQEAAVAVVIAAFRTCGALLELSHLSFEGRLLQLLRLALLAHHYASSSMPSCGESIGGVESISADPEAILLARGAFDSTCGSFSADVKSDLEVVACGLFCRLARSFGALRQLPPLMAAFLATAQGTGPAVAGTARRLFAQPQSPLRRAFAAAASRAPSGQLAAGTRVVSEAVAAALHGDNALNNGADGDGNTNGEKASNEVCNLALDVARVWLQHWPVRSPASASVGSAAVAKAAAAPLVEPLQRVVMALMVSGAAGAEIVVGKSNTLSAKASVNSTSAAAATAKAAAATAKEAAIAASEGMQDWRLAAGLQWYSLLLQAAQSCEAWLARGVDEPPTPPLLIQHCGEAPSPGNEVDKNSMDLDRIDVMPENEKEEGKRAAIESSEVAKAVMGMSGWDEGQLLGSLLTALLSAEVLSTDGTAGAAAGAVALAAGELALVRLHQLHASLGVLPLFEDRAAAEAQGGQWRQEAVQLLDFLLLNGGGDGAPLLSGTTSSSTGGGDGGGSTVPPSSSKKKAKKGKVENVQQTGQSASRLALQLSCSQVKPVGEAVVTVVGGGGSVSSVDAAALLGEAARQSPVWAPLAQPKHLLALLKPLLRDAVGWPQSERSAENHENETKDKEALCGLAGLLADASFWEVDGLQAWLPHAALLVAVDLLTALTVAAAPPPQSVHGQNDSAKAAHEHALVLMQAAAAAAAPDGPLLPGALVDAALAAALEQSAITPDNAGDKSLKSQKEHEICSALGRLGALLAAAPLQDTAPHALPALVAAALAVSVACGNSSNGDSEAAAAAGAVATWVSGAASWTAHLAAHPFATFKDSSSSSSSLDLFAGTSPPGRAGAWVRMLCRRAASSCSVVVPAFGGQANSTAAAGDEAAAGWLHSVLLFLLRAAKQSSIMRSTSSINNSSGGARKGGLKSKASSTAAVASAREALEAVETEIRSLLEGTRSSNSTELTPAGKNPKSATKQTKTSQRAAAAASDGAMVPKWAFAWNPSASLPLCAALRAIVDAFAAFKHDSTGLVDESSSSALDNDGNDACAARSAESAGLATEASSDHDEEEDDDDDDELAAAVSVAASSSGANSQTRVGGELPNVVSGTSAADFKQVWHATGAAKLAAVAVEWADTAADAATEAAEAATTEAAAVGTTKTSGANTTVVGTAAAGHDAWSSYAAQVYAVDAVLRVVALINSNGQGGGNKNDDDDEWSSSVGAAVAQASSLASRPLVDLASAGLLQRGDNGAATTSATMTRAATAAASLAHTLSSRALSDRDTAALMHALLSSRDRSIEAHTPRGGNASSNSNEADQAADQLAPDTEAVGAEAIEATQVQRAALQTLVHHGASTDQRRSLLARLTSDLESALQAEPLTGNRRRGGSHYSADSAGSAKPLLPCLKLLVLALGACCSGDATNRSGLSGASSSSSPSSLSSQPWAVESFHPGASVLDALLESACMAVDRHANDLATKAHSKSWGPSKRSPESTGAAEEVAHARSVVESAECVALGMECLRLLLGVKGLLHAKHWHVARALGAASSAAQAAEAISSGLRQWELQNRKKATRASASARSASETQAAAWAAATEAAAWAMERAVTCVSRLLRTHGKLVYAAAALLAQLHSACFHAVAQLVDDAFVLTTSTSGAASSSAAVPTLHANLSLTLLKRLGGRSARALARLLSDTSADAHQLSLKKHLPPLLMDAMAGLELPGWASLASSSSSNADGHGDKSMGGGGSSSSFGKRDLQPGILACLAALGPREVQLVSSLLPGGRDGAPRALFKQLLEDYTKRHKYRGQH